MATHLLCITAISEAMVHPPTTNREAISAISPHRVRATLKDALDALGDRRIAVCRELTKRYEEIWRGSISDALIHFTEPRGEFTLVIEGIVPAAAPVASEGLDAAIASLRASGATSKDAIAELGQRFGLSRREAYRLWHAGGS